MNHLSYRKSWNTNVKHLVRHGVLHDVLTFEQINTIPRSNLSRWKQEADDKYFFCEINAVVKKEIELIKRINQSSKIKRINQSYFKLADTFHEVISKVKGVKQLLKNQKELVVNTIESVKHCIPIDTALKVFNISRSAFENYKSIVIHNCNALILIGVQNGFQISYYQKKYKPLKTTWLMRIIAIGLKHLSI